MNAKGNGAPVLTWPLFIGLVSVLSIIFGGTWVLFSAARTADREYVNANIESLRAENARNQQDVIMLRSMVIATDTGIKSEVSAIRRDLVERYQLFLTQKEFVLHEKSSDDRWNAQAAINRQAVDAYQSSKAWEAWRTERDKLISDLRERVQELERRRVSAP